MKLATVKLNQFRRFTDLTITGLNETAKLVVLAGPNGCGKSSLFDAFNVWYQLNSGSGWSGDESYYAKADDTTMGMSNRVAFSVHGDSNPARKGAFYFRSAYRNDPEFSLQNLQRMPAAIDDIRFRRMIEGDAAVSLNYQRLASQAFEGMFASEPDTMTIGEFREKTIGLVRDSVQRLLPDLVLNNLGNPLEEGTFRFKKGTTKSFAYKNLSGGEKAAFDLILDIVIKRTSFEDSVYCIDEPEAHMSTRLQGRLLQELYDLVPNQSQLWVATHSIGMMRKARELSDEFPGTVAFLDFGGHDFDAAVTITPSRPTRQFWESVLNVALDDLAELVTPEEIVVCEGNPTGSVPGKNAEHDASCYNTIFSDEKAGTKFIAGGNAHDVAADRLGFVAAFPLIARGIKVRRLIDRDDHAPADVADFEINGVTVLGRRHIEVYLYDDEVLAALCDAVGQPHEIANLLIDKQQAMAESVGRQNPHDDVKSAAGAIFTKAKQRLKLTGVGNDQQAFARNTLAPLIKPGMATYDSLKDAIFGELA